MKAIAQYRGNMLNHVEALYRPGDRDLAIEFGELLGCVVADTGIDAGDGTTFLAVHPNADDLDVDNNAFYLSEVTPEHRAVETILAQLSDGSAALRESLDRYRDKARSWPFGIPHFGIRYRSQAEIEAVEARLEMASHRLKQRVRIRLFRPGDADALTEFVQGFVHQDVIVAGSFLLGQLIELQYQPEHVPA